MNKVVLMGRLTKQPEFKVINTDTAVCSFTLAVNKGRKNDEADFVNVVTWRNTAEFCNKYFLKGQRIAISGRLQTRSWETEEGTKRYITEVIADEVFFADSKKNTSVANAVMEIPESYVYDYNMPVGQ